MWPETSRDQAGAAVAPLSGTWETPPFFMADPKNCFVLWWIIWDLASILLELTVERAEILSLSPLLLLVVGRVEGGARLQWTDLLWLQGTSRLWEQELYVWISLAFHYCHSYLLLTFLFFSYSNDSSIDIAKTPQKLTLHLLQSCIKDFLEEIAGNCLLILWLKWMLPCASPGAGNSDQINCDAQGQLVAAPQSVWKLRKVPVHVLLLARVCTWWCKGPVRGWELCPEAPWYLWTSRASLSAWVCSAYLVSPPALIWIFQERPVGPEV